MESCSLKLLETAVLRTLHANAFSRSSTAASHILTDLLSRYLVLLGASAAAHAQHAGRTSLSIHDALAALEDLGVATDELTDFAAIEAKELSRYAVYSSRRIEDLNELRAQLADGLKQDRDDRIYLTYAPYDRQEAAVNEADQGDEADEEAMQVDQALTPPKRYSPRPLSPRPFPPSPVSIPTSPSRKRPRTDGWHPPEHVPHFLPPFPAAAPPSPVSPTPAQLPEIEEQQMLPPMPPPLPPSLSIRPQIPPVMPPPLATTAQTMTSSAASDYLVQVPYSQSSLSSIPEWHLPSFVPPASTVHHRAPAQVLPTPQTEHSLLAAYHYILTHPPPLHPLFPGRTTIPAGAADVPIGPNTLLPSRHKVAMTLLYQTQALSRWDPADSLFGTVSPCTPRVAAIAPTYPIPTDDNKERNAKDFKFPPVLARPVGAPERIAPVVSQQGSRVPDLARHVLPSLIFSRTSRLAHPPILHRGQKALTYGQGVPAPWNSSPEAGAAATAAPPVPTSSAPNTPSVPFKPFKAGAGGVGAKDTPPNGKPSDVRDKEREREKGGTGQGQGQATKPGGPLPEAKLFATWDYEPKDYRIPLALPARSRTRMASIAAVGTGAGEPGMAAVGSVAGLRSRSAARMATG